MVGYPDGNYIKIRYYKNLNGLLTADYENEISIPKTIAAPHTSEGTPTVLSMELQPNLLHSEIKIGFHANNGNTDIPAIGVLKDFNSNSWEAGIDENRLHLFQQLGNIHGNIGSRDDFTFQGKRYAIQEAQKEKENFATWDSYIYDYHKKQLTPLDMKTHGDSTSFGNPTLTPLTLPDGTAGYVVTQYVFTEGAAAGEAGQLLYFFS